MSEAIQPRQGLYLCSNGSLEHGVKPCPEAFEVVIVHVDTRSSDDPRKIPAFNGTDGDWYTSGSNHRVVKGKIKRDIGFKSVWAVEITDIQAFVDKHGECVLERDNDGFCTIHIAPQWA